MDTLFHTEDNPASIPEFIKQTSIDYGWKEADIVTSDQGVRAVYIPFYQFPSRPAQCFITAQTHDPSKSITLELTVEAYIEDMHDDLTQYIKDAYGVFTRDPYSQGGCFVSESDDVNGMRRIWWQCGFTTSPKWPIDTKLVHKLFRCAFAGYEILFFGFHMAEFAMKRDIKNLFPALPTEGT
jgi:hypothetical protein